MQQHFPQIDIIYDCHSTVPPPPVLLHLRPHISLLFSGTHQRLHTIHVHDLRISSPPLILKYKDAILSSPDRVLHRLGVSKTFGPTYPSGNGDNGLRYPGLWFGFDDDTEAATRQSEDRLQEVKKILILQKDPHDPLGEVIECPVMHGDIERAVIKVKPSLLFYFLPCS